MHQKKQYCIGVFDSGFGGLNILRAIVKKLPNYNYIYLGDNARTPYGTRSPEIIYEFTKQAVDFLFTKNCELVILACNTASSDALRKIQQEHLPKHHPNKKVLGVLIPAAEEAILTTKNHKIGVIATEGTVKSKAFPRELTKLNPKIKVFQQSCPLLVPLVEEGEQNSKVTLIMLEKYLKPLKNQGVDTLILGCTHYGIIKNQIKKIIGSDVSTVSESDIVPVKLKEYLSRHPEIDTKLGKNKFLNFYTTDLTDKFIVLGSKFFGQKIRANKISLK